MARRLTNPTSIHEDAGLIPGLSHGPKKKKKKKKKKGADLWLRASLSNVQLVCVLPGVIMDPCGIRTPYPTPDITF